MRRDGWLDAASAIRFDAPNAFKLPRLAHPMCQHTIVIIPLGSQLKHTTQQWHLWQTSPSCCIRQHPNKNYRTCWVLPSPASHHTWAATRTNHFLRALGMHMPSRLHFRIAKCFSFCSREPFGHLFCSLVALASCQYWPLLIDVLTTLA